MILVTQLAGIVQSRVAFTAGADDASVAVLRIAWLIFMLPHSIIAVSIATPYFTRMSAQRPRRRPRRGARRPVVLAAHHRAARHRIRCRRSPPPPCRSPPSSRNAPREVVGIGGVLLAYLIGLVPFSMLFLLQRAYYALGDTRTPFLFQLVQAVLFVTGAARRDPRPRRAGRRRYRARDLAGRHRPGGPRGACCCAGVSAAAAARRIVRRFGAYLLATIPAAAAGVGILWLLGGLPGDGGGFAVSGRMPGVLSVVVIGLVVGRRLPRRAGARPRPRGARARRHHPRDRAPQLTSAAPAACRERECAVPRMC